MSIEEIIKVNIPFVGTYGDEDKEYKIDVAARKDNGASPLRFNLPPELKRTLKRRQEIESLERAIMFFRASEEGGVKYVILTDDIRLLNLPEEFYPLLHAEEAHERFFILQNSQRVFKECDLPGRVVYVGKGDHIRIYNYDAFQQRKKAQST